MQMDDGGRNRVVAFASRQLKAAELNYSVHDKELLAIKYALLKFRVHLMGGKPFVVYTDHASLRTATSSPHLLQRMERWLSFFAEYNFRIEYKPGKANVLADALSRRPDLEVAVQATCSTSADAGEHTFTLASALVSTVTSDLADSIRAACAADPECRALIAHYSGGEAVPARLLKGVISRHLALAPCV